MLSRYLTQELSITTDQEPHLDTLLINPMNVNIVHQAFRISKSLLQDTGYKREPGSCKFLESKLMLKLPKSVKKLLIFFLSPKKKSLLFSVFQLISNFLKPALILQ